MSKETSRKLRNKRKISNKMKRMLKKTKMKTYLLLRKRFLSAREATKVSGNNRRMMRRLIRSLNSIDIVQ